jgi:hypothetical protein
MTLRFLPYKFRRIGRAGRHRHHSKGCLVLGMDDSANLCSNCVFDKQKKVIVILSSSQIIKSNLNLPIID